MYFLKESNFLGKNRSISPRQPKCNNIGLKDPREENKDEDIFVRSKAINYSKDLPKEDNREMKIISIEMNKEMLIKENDAEGGWSDNLLKEQETCTCIIDFHSLIHR